MKFENYRQTVPCHFHEYIFLIGSFVRRCSLTKRESARSRKSRKISRPGHCFPRFIRNLCRIPSGFRCSLNTNWTQWKGIHFLVLPKLDDYGASADHRRNCQVLRRSVGRKWLLMIIWETWTFSGSQSIVEAFNYQSIGYWNRYPPRCCSKTSWFA